MLFSYRLIAKLLILASIMKWAFLISGIIEIIGGIICYLYPQFIFTNNHMLTDIFGISAITIGVINILAHRFHDSTRFFTLLTVCMMFMHGALAMVCYRANPIEFPTYLGATITHLSLFIIFLFFYLKDIKPVN